MAVKPISDRGRHIVLALSRRHGPVRMEELARELARLGSIDNDLAELVAGGTISARGLMTEAQMKAELDHVWPYLVQAQRSGAEFRWRTQNVFAYELTKVGRDMVPLLARLKG
ncbi:MAG: hypothetical protein J0M02_07875 [Planctomycetes bacterium]|nr:hypothetical protein [Planctomycetota bacterium]